MNNDDIKQVAKRNRWVCYKCLENPYVHRSDFNSNDKLLPHRLVTPFRSCAGAIESLNEWIDITRKGNLDKFLLNDEKYIDLFHEHICPVFFNQKNDEHWFY